MKIKYYGDKIEKSTRAISLCGPTPRNNKVTSWRKEALNILQNTNYDGIVYVPELKDGNLPGCHSGIIHKYHDR